MIVGVLHLLTKPVDKVFLQAGNLGLGLQEEASGVRRCNLCHVKPWVQALPNAV